jgi:ferredoxin
VPASVLAPAARVLLNLAQLDRLFAVLRSRGYTLIGPRVVGAAITYRPIDSVEDLPRGWDAVQGPGSYKIRRRSDAALFGFGPGFDSLKRYLLPPSEVLFEARREKGGIKFLPTEAPAPRLAFIGVRPCELEAIARLDKVFLEGPYVDPRYQARRAAMFLVAANCVDPAETCFCASMNTGPRAQSLYDLALTELPGERFLAESGSVPGASALEEVESAEAPADAAAQADAALHSAAARMRREVDTSRLSTDLRRVLEHPEWDDVAKRCLACANCTMVCPTCFCHTVQDHTDLSGQQMERRRRWDTCFTSEFSYIHGGSIRPSVRARYRQWLLHKFSTWMDQFGTYGCVGCGRCITWCPVGIDVTEELTRLRG